MDDDEILFFEDPPHEDFASVLNQALDLFFIEAEVVCIEMYYQPEHFLKYAAPYTRLCIFT